MATYTPNMDLLKKNPATEGSDYFNIGTMLNDNWDKIDSFAALLEASIAPLYSTSSAYAVGSWCTHDGKLYQCTTAIGSGGESWNASHWTAKSTSELIAAVKAAIPSAYTSAPAMNGTAAAGSSTKWAKGDHVHPVDTSRAAKAALSSLINPNILHNAYFLGGGSQLGGGAFPINHRGLTSYSGNVYSIDRWRGWYADTLTTIENNGLKIKATAAIAENQRLLNQTIENPAQYSGKTLTMSFLVTAVSGEINVSLRTANPTTTNYSVPVSAPGFYTRTFTLNDNVSDMRMTVNTINGAIAKNAYITIAAMKLEVGETQTLAHNEGTDANPVWVLNGPPDYTEELLRCSRAQEIDSGDTCTGAGLFRQEAFVSSDTTPTIEGAVNWTYV